MNEGTSRSFPLHRATLQSAFRFGMPSGMAYLILGASLLIIIFGCAPPQAALTTAAAPEPEPRSAQSPPTPVIHPREPNEHPTTTPQQQLEGSGKMVWAKGYRGQLIAGLDGALYEPYRAAIIKHVQQVLNERGLYPGPINGILDLPTMKAIYTFQEANHNLQMCGVPTPHTRKMLEQGSHTDLSS